MNALRVTLCVPGATAAQLLPVARLADHWNLGGLWIGDPAGRAANREDSYVTAAAAAVASATEDLRIGVLVALPEGQHEIRVAEDVAVVDNASGGRMELGLVAPASASPDDAWVTRAATFLRSWSDWPMPDGGTVAVTPLPAQPWLPRVVVGERAIAEALDAGWMALDGDIAPAREALVARRTIAARTLGDVAVFDWLASDPPARVAELRGDASALGAHELLLVFAAAPDARDIEMLGRVVVPALRCVPDEIEGIVEDAWTWLTEHADIHDAPA